MEIKYLGHSAFLLKGSQGKVVTDPFDSTKMGKKFPKVEADLVTISHGHDDHNASDIIDGNPLVITYPGEYEKNAIRVQGFETYHDANKGADRGKNTMYKFIIDEISVLHCGDLGHLLDNETMDEIEEVDVLLIPVGGFYTITAEEAAHVVAKLEPKIVIPMHYKEEGFSEEIMSKLTPVEDFLSKMSATGTEPQDKLVLKKQDLGEDMKVIVLKA